MVPFRIKARPCLRRIVQQAEALLLLSEEKAHTFDLMVDVDELNIALDLLNALEDRIAMDVDLQEEEF